MLAGFTQALELFASTSLAGLLVIGLPPHLLAKAAPLAELPEPADCFLDGLSRTHP